MLGIVEQRTLDVFETAHFGSFLLCEPITYMKYACLHSDTDAGDVEYSVHMHLPEVYDARIRPCCAHPP